MAEEEKVRENPVIVIKEKIKRNPLVSILILVLIVGVIVALSVGIPAINRKKEKDDKAHLESAVFQIKEVLNTARLNTAEYPYKAVVNWFYPEDDGRQTKVGLVKYTGKIKYGVDFDQITVTSLEEKKAVLVTIPPLIRTPIVEDSKCIFVSQETKNRFNDSQYLKLMRQACEEHITYSEDANPAMAESARKYTIEIVESMTRPFFDEESGITLEIRMEDEDENE